MKIKVTVEVKGGFEFDYIDKIVDIKEVDMIIRSAVGGIIEKYKGRVGSISDTYEQMIGTTAKSKMIVIEGEEKKEEGKI